jgi:hypothetical protein
MPFKPMPVKKYKEYIRIANWKLEKGSIDWKLFNEEGNLVCAIMISVKTSIKRSQHIASIKQKTLLKKQDYHGHQKRNRRTSKNSSR